MQLSCVRDSGSPTPSPPVLGVLLQHPSLSALPRSNNRPPQYQHQHQGLMYLFTVVCRFRAAATSFELLAVLRVTLSTIRQPLLPLKRWCTYLFAVLSVGWLCVCLFVCVCLGVCVCVRARLIVWK